MRLLKFLYAMFFTLSNRYNSNYSNDLGGYMFDKIMKSLLIFIPITIGLNIMHGNDTLIFVSALLAIMPLAKIMGDSTEVIASKTSPKIGGFLNATFGNATEMILSIVALTAGLTEMVKASIVGSVVSNLLLVLGLSMFAGGLKIKNQKFSRKSIDLSVTMLILSLACILIPTGFFNSTDELLLSGKIIPVSDLFAVAMLIVYLAGLFFSFYTHKDIYGTEHDEVAEEVAGKSDLIKAGILLFLSTIFVAVMSEMLVHTVESVSESIGLSQFFIGLIIIPIIGNAAEHSAAVIMAMKNKMDIAIEIAVGSSLQIILFVFPILILIGTFTQHPMSIIFNRFELVALLASVVVVAKVASDGESNWFEGMLLSLVYVLLALATFFVTL